MFENLEDLSVRYDEVLMEMNDPALTGDQVHFRKLMKEHAELTPLVEAYRKYKAANQTIEDSISMLDSESDEEMRELLKEELAQAKDDVAKLENEIKILLLPKDPNDDKNVVVEIRAGAGGDEAALFS
ncbi:MAG: PCRF domain-containing protein, partial [Lachnospiraceae bacterium]|nr:PCRF domain-containing protein [Lachnospiraceae bacterium]